jgi:hypothetical protein
LDAPNIVALQATFQAIPPRIETHAAIYFRHLRCPQTKADMVREMRSLAWKWLIRLTKKGKDVNDFPVTFVWLLAKAVASGRRLTGMQKAKDVLNPATQKRRGFSVEPLEPSTRISHERLYAVPNVQELHDAYEERLRDNTLTPVPDQVQFRIDFAAWLDCLTARERKIIQAMAMSEQTKVIAQQFHVSPGRISQMRQELHDDWVRFCEGAPDA